MSILSDWHQPGQLAILSIYGIYIAPLQGNYSEALPAQARAKRKVNSYSSSYKQVLFLFSAFKLNDINRAYLFCLRTAHSFLVLVL